VADELDDRVNSVAEELGRLESMEIVRQLPPTPASRAKYYERMNSELWQYFEKLGGKL
jgi:hypothetical protein